MSISLSEIRPIVLVISFMSNSVFAQTDNYILKWKLKKNDSLIYKTEMIERPIIAYDDDSFTLIPPIIFVDTSHEKKNELTEINDSIITKLSKKREGVIDIEMVKKSNSKNLIAGQKIGFNRNIILRGSIYDNGTIESFYLSSRQKNLLALLFQLPNKSLRIGDTWTLDVNLVSMDQTIICDSAKRVNQATLVNVETNGADTIAYLRYNVSEYFSGHFENSLFREQNTTMNIIFSAVGKFSISKGHWTYYDGDIVIHSSGILTSDMRTDFHLELPK